VSATVGGMRAEAGAGSAGKIAVSYTDADMQDAIGGVIVGGRDGDDEADADAVVGRMKAK